MGDLAKQLNIQPAYLAHLASAVQFGFIGGTLIFAILSIADRFSPVRVFFTCALIAAVINLGASVSGVNLQGVLLVRFLTGFFLAGIYPVGMKIASDHFQQGLGKSLGYLVGALVLGTAFPHLLKGMIVSLPWQYVIYATSSLSALGGLAMLVLVPDGPYRRPGQKLHLGGFLSGFKNKPFRAAALGYFGHMWELYAFWVFVPVMLGNYLKAFPNAGLSIPLLSFIVIASGSLACVFSGIVSQRAGAKKVATIALSISCICCLASPLFLFNPATIAFIAFMFVWSLAVIADSPLFSTLVAQNAPAEFKGTSLTIVNCIGFAITIVSIQLLNALQTPENSRYIYMLLAAGPILGLLALLNPSAQAK